VKFFQYLSANRTIQHIMYHLNPVDWKTMITCNGLPCGRASHGLKLALLLATLCYTAAAQNPPQISWYTLGGSDFNPLTGQTTTLGIQVFLHSTDPRVVAFRATTAVQLGSGLGAPAVQGTATNVLDDTDTMVYVPVTAYSANASLQTMWVLVELFLTDGSTFTAVQRLPAPWQSYPIAITANSATMDRAGVRNVR
jgi:hypothetical protein